MIYISVLGTIISLAALVVAGLAYRLNRRLPNENKIFDEKIRVYHEIIKCLNEALNEIVGCIEDYYENKKSKEHSAKEFAYELNGDIDDAINSVEDVIANNSLVLPEIVLEKLTDFFDFLDEPEYLERYSKPADFEKLRETLDLHFNNAVDAMRNDLEFEKLDTGLRSRIKGNRISKFIE